MTCSTVEVPSMAKTQKTLVLSDDLCKLIQAYADKKGTSFSRAISAAALQFFFSYPKVIENEWVGLAVQLEKGDVSLSEAPTKWCNDRAEVQELLAGSLKRAGEPDSVIRNVLSDAKHWRDIAEEWKCDVNRMGGETDGLIKVRLIRDDVFLRLRKEGEVSLNEDETRAMGAPDIKIDNPIIARAVIPIEMPEDDKNKDS